MSQLLKALVVLFSQRYERGATLVTSNLPFGEWTSIFGSERLTGALLDRLPSLDAKALHTLGEALAGTDPQPLAAFVDTVNVWLSQRLHGGANDIGRLDRLAEAWQQVNAAARDAETYNLERKPLIFSVFGLLAEATRG